MIGSRRWRSISFCTNGVGTDSRAKPSVMTSGLTSLNQALCWGVRVGSGGVAVDGSPAVGVTVEFGNHVVPDGDEGGIGVSCQ